MIQIFQRSLFLAQVFFYFFFHKSKANEESGMAVYILKKRKGKNPPENEFDMDAEKLESLCVTGGNVKWCSCYVHQYMLSNNMVVPPKDKNTI